MLTHSQPLPRSRLRLGAYGVLLATFAAWCVGAVLFIAADGSVTWTIPQLDTPPDGLHNLAHYRWGPTLRASSYHREVDSHHHPAFLIDGHAKPSLVEKWASDTGDRDPWVEIRWRRPRALERVVIRHVGWREDSWMTVRHYRLSCLGVENAPTVMVSDNVLPISAHDLACPHARGLRIEWVPNEPGEIVRAYEIEAWGR